MGSPEIILFDILFTERSSDDNSVVQLNQTYPNISHAVNMRMDLAKKTLGDLEKSKAVKFEIKGKHFPKYNSISLPAGEIGCSSNLTHVVNIIPDSDGVIR